MIKKFIKYIINNQNKIRDIFAIMLFKLKILPKEFEGRVRAIDFKRKYDKDFKKLKLEYNQAGFYFLNPMPSENYLKKYYINTYWQSRTDKDYPLRLRDIEHLKLLKKNFPRFDETEKKVLNFGAGHGGISFFLHSNKHNIFNYEPGGMKEYFDERWNILKDLSNINTKFDLIYGSHSLEHVQDIKKTLELFDRISHKETIFFFEVPNCYNESSKIIEPPHTYYFTRKFFDNHFLNNNSCKTYANYKEQKNEEGEVIVMISTASINKID